MRRGIHGTGQPEALTEGKEKTVRRTYCGTDCRHRRGRAGGGVHSRLRGSRRRRDHPAGHPGAGGGRGRPYGAAGPGQMAAGGRCRLPEGDHRPDPGGPGHRHGEPDGAGGVRDAPGGGPGRLERGPRRQFLRHRLSPDPQLVRGHPGAGPVGPGRRAAVPAGRKPQPGAEPGPGGRCVPHGGGQGRRLLRHQGRRRPHHRRGQAGPGPAPGSDHPVHGPHPLRQHHHPGQAPGPGGPGAGDRRPGKERLL